MSSSISQHDATSSKSCYIKFFQTSFQKRYLLMFICIFFLFYAQNLNVYLVTGGVSRMISTVNKNEFDFHEKPPDTNHKSVNKASLIENKTNIPLIFNSNTTNIPADYKKVLFYTSFFGGSWIKFFRNGRLNLTDHRCEVTKCAFTFDKSLASSVDALIFHASNFSQDNVPEIRYPHQRYIWLNVEAPSLTLKKSNEKFHGKPGFFNWTATHQTASEIILPYGGLVPLKGDRIPNRPYPLDINSSTYRDYMNVLESNNIFTSNELLNASFLLRPKVVAWMVSHCSTVSGRELYVQELQRYLSVDVYGECGNFKCGKNHMDTYCYTDVLAPKYKFYLSFENNWCHDYITEKVWLPMMHGLVPVVYGGANYEDFLPPHSFIDAGKLSPNNLAKILHRIATSDEEYAKYHIWRDYWRVLVPTPMCDMCYQLHHNTKETNIHDLGWWWAQVNNCSTRYPEDKYPRAKPFLFNFDPLESLRNLRKGLGYWVNL